MKVRGEFSGPEFVRSLSFFDVIMMLSETKEAENIMNGLVEKRTFKYNKFSIFKTY